MNVNLRELIDVDKLRRKVSEEIGLNESYVVQAPSVEMATELMSPKSKKILQSMIDLYAAELNHVSAELDTASRDLAMPDASRYVALKAQEGRLLQLNFLLGLHITNISDVQSVLTMDSLTFMRLERDFGSFDSWQKDFMACALSSRNGWVATYLNTYTQTYMNCAIDLHSDGVPVGMYPIIVVDMWQHAYYKDYLKDTKTYLVAMMKQLNWHVIDERFKKADKILKVLRGE